MICTKMFHGTQFSLLRKILKLKIFKVCWLVHGRGPNSLHFFPEIVTLHRIYGVMLMVFNFFNVTRKLRWVFLSVILTSICETFWLIVWRRVSFHVGTGRQGWHTLQQHKECLLSAVRRRDDHTPPLSSQGQYYYYFFIILILRHRYAYITWRI